MQTPHRMRWNNWRHWNLSKFNSTLKTTLNGQYTNVVTKLVKNEKITWINK